MQWIHTIWHAASLLDCPARNGFNKKECIAVAHGFLNIVALP